MLSHRLTTSTGAVVDEPSMTQLRELVAEVERSGTSGFLIVERRGRQGETYLQASKRDAATWTIELRDGGPDRHYRADAADAAVVFASIMSWIADSTTWRSLAWQKVGRRGRMPVAQRRTTTSGGPRFATV